MDNFLRQLIKDSNKITEDEYSAFLKGIYDNQITKEEIIAFTAALSAKPLQINDIICFVKFIESISPRKLLTSGKNAVNIVGTGGGIPTFNISTTAAFVAGAAGAKVLKNGSYAYNSKSGSLDVLKALGLNLALNESSLNTMLDELNIGFIGPHLYSPFLRRIAASIYPLNLSDIGGFINKIGPFLCPYQVGGQVTGVGQASMIDPMAEAMVRLGMKNTVLVWADIGLDEFSAIGPNHVAMVNQTIEKSVLSPESLGFHHTSYENLSGGSADDNAAIIRSVLKNGVPLEARDTVVMNAAHAIVLSGKESNLQYAVERALEAIATGRAYGKLKDSVAFTNDTQTNWDDTHG